MRHALSTAGAPARGLLGVCAERRRVRLAGACRAAARRAARPLLPHARLGPRRRRRPAGHVAARLARAARLRGQELAALVALSDRDQQLPQADPAAPAAGDCRSTTARQPTRARARPSPRAEVAWLEPYPEQPDASYEQREGVELAFVAALQHLPPRQRAVLILRDVLGFSAAEVGDALHAAPDAVYSILQRAHRAVNERLPERSQQETLRSLGDARVKRLAERFVAAWEADDVDAIMDAARGRRDDRDAAAAKLVPRARGDSQRSWPPARSRESGAGGSWRHAPTGSSRSSPTARPRTAASPRTRCRCSRSRRTAQIQDITAFLDPDERWIQDPTRISVTWNPRHIGPPDGFSR